MSKYIDVNSIIVISITFILFVIALFTKGLTHDILLEAGVLLISIKIIMLSYKLILFYDNILQELKKINEKLGKHD